MVFMAYEHRRYWELAKHLVVSVNGEIGYGDAYGDTTRLPFFENYYGGGAGSVRGFEARSLGPRDSEDDPIGGNLYYAGGLELLFPPPFVKESESVRLAAFVDAGTVLDTDQSDYFDSDELRYSFGLGASWLSPVGALTVSLGFPFNAPTGDEDDEERFQFSFGSTF